MTAFDSRTTPARSDLAAEHLKGHIKAERYAKAVVKANGTFALDLHRSPDLSSIVDNQLLFGDSFAVYEEREGWAWGQLLSDGYVGYVRTGTLGPAIDGPTHRVTAPSSHLYIEPDAKSPALTSVPFGARLKAVGQGELFDLVDTPLGRGYVPSRHVRPLGDTSKDFVAVAERFLGVPYRWGGRTVLGLDCSGLVQMALVDTGIAAMRDSDQQQSLGTKLPPEALGDLRRGDLIFWSGHVAIAHDDRHMIHANGTAMCVSIDDARDYAKRIGPRDGPVVQISRLSNP